MTARLAAAIVLAFSAGSAAGVDLGRMFFTPAQRATLDNARKQNIQIEIGSDKEQAAAPVPQNVSINGVVRRSDGKSTVWINNQAVTGRQAGGMGVAPGKTGDRVKLTVPESGRSVDLKVGQTVEIVSGTIEEAYSRRVPPQPEANSAPAGENTAPRVTNLTPPLVSAPAKPRPTIPRRSTRTGSTDAQDDLPPDGGSETK